MIQTKKELYKRVYAELFGILDTLKDEEIEKIPKDVKKNIYENMDTNYRFKYDYSKKLEDQDILPETKALIIEIYIKYLVENEDEKEAWEIYKKECLNKVEEEKKARYNPDDIFKNHIVDGKPIIEEYEEISVPVSKKKESFFRKILNKIKDFFYR